MAGKTKFGPDGRTSARGWEDALTQMSRPKSKRGYLAARWFVWGSVGAIVFFTIGSAVQSNNSRSLVVKLDERLETQYNPSFRVRYEDLGKAVVLAYYTKGALPPISLGEGVDWSGPTGTSGQSAPSITVPVSDGSTDAAVAAGTAPPLSVQNVSFYRGDQVKLAGSKNAYQERLTYYALINNVAYNIDLTIGIPDLDNLDSRPVLLSTPTVSSPAVVGTSSFSTKPRDVDDAKLGDGAETQLASWAEAWSEDDRATLKQIAQDGGSSIYPGLVGGWQYVPDSLEVLWSKKKDDDAVAEVSWRIKVADVVIPAQGDDKPAVTVTGPTQVQRMDVLLQDYGSGLPKISSWGPVGSYNSLEPRQAAIGGDAAEEVPTAVVPSTTAEPEAGGN